MGKVYNFLFLSVLTAAFKSYSDHGYVLHGLDMAHCNTVMAVVRECSYGKIVLDHLAADGTGLTGGQVTIVAVSQVYANFPWCPFYILNSPDNEVPAGSGLPGTNSLTGSATISPINL